MKTSSFLIGTGKGISLILAFLLADCGNYQDRARTPLKPMVSVMHGKSGAFDVPPKVLKGYRPRYPQPEADNREKGFVSVDLHDWGQWKGNRVRDRGNDRSGFCLRGGARDCEMAVGPGAEKWSSGDRASACADALQRVLGGSA